MTRVDRYIIAEFGRVFLICFITFLGLFIVADFVNNLDELVRKAKTSGGLPSVMLSYYGPKVPWFFDLLGRIVALIAAIFAITALQRNNEMAAMMAAGISRWRIVKPLVISVGVVAVLGLLNREFLIPHLGPAIMRDARNFEGNQTEDVRSQYDHATGIFFNGEGIVPASRTIEKPSFHLPTELAPRGTRIEAKVAKYFPRDKQRPAGFLLMGVEANELSVKHSLNLNEETVVFHPRQATWLKEDQLFVATGLPFRQLNAAHNWRQYASTFSLISGARNRSLDSGADVSVTVHSRFVQPVLDMVVLFLGLPVVLSRESRNAFIAVGQCMLFVSIFVGATLGLHSMGMNYLISPSLAVWLPLLIFIPIATWMSEPLRR